jgi:hypothetical protein
MSPAPFPPTPTSQIRAVLQALQSVLDLAAEAETVTLPTPYVRTWRDQLQRVLDQLDTAAPLAAPRARDWRWLLLLGGMLTALVLARLLCFP